MDNDVRHRSSPDASRDASGEPTIRPGAAPRTGRSARVPVLIAVGVAVVLLAGGALVHRAESGANKVALASEPKPVTTVVARSAAYRETHTYVGTLRPWIEASVGPQFVSAYVETVLVRPGAVVRRNEVLATLDCRNAQASTAGVAAEARAIDARQKAIADESARLNSLLDGGFVSPNEAEQKEAQSASEQAQLAAQRARLANMGLTVDDCILRAPFDGEIAARSIDPGAFVRPGTSLVSLIDRNTVRMTFDVPEADFDAVAPKTAVRIRLLSVGRIVSGAIARRAPAADPDTRTVHVEVDLDDANRELPVNTTGEVQIQVGAARPAVVVPLVAASISGDKASIFVVEGDVARKRRFAVEGEQGSDLFVEAALKPGTRVVTEGRAVLADGDRVFARDGAPVAALSSTDPASKGAPEEKKP